MADFITYSTSSPAGDLISFLAGIKQMWKLTGKRGVVYQRIGMPGISYSESIHPFENEQGEPVTMNGYMFEMLRPLLLSQEYIQDYVEFKGEMVDFNFDLIRMERYTGQPKYSLNRWPFQVFPQMTTDLSKKWIEVDGNGEANEKIVVNFTQRHRNHLIHYHFLKPYQDKIIFAGIKKERDIFCKAFDLDILHLEVSNFLELATVINGCRFFLGNASFCYQLAEAMKIPRVLELFPLMPNVIPIGEHAYDFFSQAAVEFFFTELINQKQKS